MNMFSKPILIASTAVALLLAMGLSGGKAWAGETAGQKIDRIAHKTGNGIRKGAEWAGNGIKKGATKAGEGIRKGAQKTGEAFTTVGDKLQQSSS